MDKENIETRIKVFLEKETNKKISNNSTNLINVGILDSFTIIKLITFIENELNLIVDLDKMDEDSFSTLENLANNLIKWKG